MIVEILLWMYICSYFNICRTSPGAEESTMVFEAVGGQQVPPCDLIRELEELSLTKLPSPAPSDSSSWGSTATGTSTPDNSLIIGGLHAGPHSPPLTRDIINDQTHIDITHGKFLDSNCVN